MRAAGVVFVLGLLAAGGVALADIYSYTDAEGVVHFTNLKPGGRSKWRKVLIGRPDAGSKAAADRGACPRCDRVPAADRSPERFHRYDAYIQEASQLYRIPEALIRAVIKTESDYDPRVVSAFDARGLMQLMPEEVENMHLTDVHDPRQNILGGTRLLRMHANRYDGDLVLTIAGYHAGVGAVKRYGNTVPPFPHTQKYLKKILDRYYRYKADPSDITR